MIEGPVDLQVLRKAIEDLLERHEVLRTYFYEEEGELLQSVSTQAKTDLGFTDLSTAPENERNSILRNLIREQARRPFDLGRVPLVRFHLFRLAENRHVVFFNIHHIVADRRSLRILREELSAFYQAVIRNEAASLPELPVQYADYAIWANRNLSDGMMESQIEYWRKKLAGVPPYLELQSSRPYPEQRTAWGATIPVAIPASLREALSHLGREEGATMFMTLLATFALLLYMNSGAEDFCIGSPFTYRNQVETEPLIGLFVNMLVFRFQLKGDLSFREFLSKVRATALDAYDNSDVPFQELVRTLKPDPRSLRSPLFQVMFAFDSQAESGQAPFTQIDTEPGTARFDLTLQLADAPDGIAGSFEYCTDLFEAAAIEKMVRQFMALLNRLVQNPDIPIGNLKTSEAEGLPKELQVTPHLLNSINRRSGWIKQIARRLSHRS